jgi:hypothetical protein
VTPINSQQVRGLWRQWLDQSTAREGNTSTTTDSPHNISDFGNLLAIQANLERAHRQVIGFQLISSQGESEDAAEGFSISQLPHIKTTPAPDEAGVGRIPPLPRPKFLFSLAEFALGE